HLGASDAYVIAIRKFLIKAVQDFQKGKEPPGLVWDPAKNDFSTASCISTRLPLSAPSKGGEART
ncbi:MAG: hypothetical protein V3W19_13640, partial [Desulfatiglandales bacterium]